MATAKFFDSYVSTLASSYTSGGTTLDVASAGSGASALSALGDYYVIVDPDGAAEVFKVTAVSGTTLTVVGAQAGTSAANHASGVSIRGPIWTTAFIAQMRADIVKSGPIASLPAASQAGTVYAATDSPYDLIRDTGAAWEYWKGGVKLTYPDDTGFSWVNQGGATLDTASGNGFLLTVPAFPTPNFRIRAKTAPGTPYTAEAALQVTAALATSFNVGLGFRYAVGGTFIALIHNAQGWGVFRWNGPTSFSTTSLNPQLFQVGSVLWARVKDDGTNLLYYVSCNGIDWILLFSEGRTVFLTAPSQVIWFGDAENGATSPGLVRLLHWRIF